MEEARRKAIEQYLGLAGGYINGAYMMLANLTADNVTPEEVVRIEVSIDSARVRLATLRAMIEGLQHGTAG